MYFVEEGRLRAVWQTEDGSRGDIAYMRRGDFFGERSLLLGAPRAASVEAVTPAKLLVLREADFRRLVEADAGFAAVVEARSQLRVQVRRARAARFRRGARCRPRRRAEIVEPVGLDQVEAPAAADETVEDWAAEKRSRPGESGASRTCGRWTRWTAAPPAWRWSAGTSAAR